MIVVGGGWAPFIYYRYLLGDKAHEPIRTRDIDFMVQEEVPVIGSKTVDQLLEEAGFKTVFKSRDVPPLIHYEGNIEGMDVEIEFLADQTGSRPDLVLEVQKGLHAEALRFISIVIENAVEVTIEDTDFMGGLPALKVKVPTPSAYIFHKGLVFIRRRDRDKKAKDLYYIFDIITGCSRIKPDIMDGFAGLSRKYPAWFQTFIRNLSLYFKTISSDGVLWVAEQRPSLAFPDLNADQFKQYVLAAFREFLNDLDKL
ncbi:MAG: GSU2403 family nucleotidyltransferase fold protein [Desulfobacterales bacterium]|nr:GSU2403 family nucleotidyltransferase fold protein [Desulfobacterales bacterium]